MESIGWAPDKKLYTYIYYKMGVQPGEFISSANRLTIVTFNYDRSLEFYLYQSLTNLFGNDQVAKSFIRDKIIHVYGILGTPDFLAKDGRPFEPICNEENIKKCIDSMWMITEAESNPIRFDDTHHPIGAADVVCFLGFGYSRENIRRLNIKQSWFKEKRFYGSAYGLAADDIEAINRFSDSSIRLGPTNEKAIEFMQNQSVLR